MLAAGFAALAVPGVRLTRGEWLGIARILALALPLLAVMASARPSEPDFPTCCRHLRPVRSKRSAASVAGVCGSRCMRGATEAWSAR